MIKYYSYSKQNGRYISKVTASRPFDDTPQIGYTTSEPATTTDYLNEEGIWITPPSSPHSLFLFDYDKKEWVLKISLDQVKEQTWEKVKQQRQELFDKGLFVGPYLFDLSLESLTQMSLLLTSDAEYVQWTLRDNRTIHFTINDFKHYLNVLNTYRNDIHIKTQKLRNLIQNSQDVFELDAIRLD